MSNPNPTVRLETTSWSMKGVREPLPLSFWRKCKVAVPIKPFQVGDWVEMRKPHPCGSHYWHVLRTGADVRIACGGCGHQVMLPRVRFEKGMKKIITDPEVIAGLLAAARAAASDVPASSAKGTKPAARVLKRITLAESEAVGAGGCTEASSDSNAMMDADAVPGRNAMAAVEAGSNASTRNGRLPR